MEILSSKIPKSYMSKKPEEVFLPTLSSTLKKIFPDAPENVITRYEKQLTDVEELDPILVVTPNNAWVDQYGWPAYNEVMNTFATYGLTGNRRDKSSRCMFHFKELSDLYCVRDEIQSRNLAPNAFNAQPNLRIGTAWILLKIGSSSSDYGQDKKFFLLEESL
ncbi:8612_t:CDS:2 [Diversispora eburnea]|uniref:8612_t:CDS:1 n=1 Tax=Diversispora eburnea TaxID=1213867 RepID=A0A9N9GUM6_9GLOM|nr:8612_t:CDS:2 [Diversispora eburnea]